MIDLERLHPLDVGANIRIGVIGSAADVLINYIASISANLIGFNLIDRRQESSFCHVKPDFGGSDRREIERFDIANREPVRQIHIACAVPVLKTIRINLEILIAVAVFFDDDTVYAGRCAEIHFDPLIVILVII